MDNYTLRSGETIDISCLRDTDREHISRIEKLIADSADYHEVYREAFAPLKEGRGFTAKSLLELHNTPQYKIVLDMVTRYWERMSSPTRQ